MELMEQATFISIISMRSVRSISTNFSIISRDFTLCYDEPQLLFEKAEKAEKARFTQHLHPVRYI